jgi:RNA polymerase sigma-70 factor (ECF subfamily)
MITNEKTQQTKDPNRTRATLLQRVRNQHDEAAWNDFVLIYRNYVYAIIRRMNISDHDAEDLTQELMLNMWNKLPQTDVERIRRFRSWLSTITKNLVTDFIRKRMREADRLEKAEQDTTLSYLKAIRLPDIEPIAKKEWRIHLTNLALANIESIFSGHAIEVFRLSLAGLEIKAIAAKLDLQENSVYRLKNRVKKRLIQEIEQLRNDLEPDHPDRPRPSA